MKASNCAGCGNTKVQGKTSCSVCGAGYGTIGKVIKRSKVTQLLEEQQQQIVAHMDHMFDYYPFQQLASQLRDRLVAKRCALDAVQVVLESDMPRDSSAVLYRDTIHNNKEIIGDLNKRIDELMEALYEGDRDFFNQAWLVALCNEIEA